MQKSATLPCWYPRPDLNRDLRFRKPLLYPVELRGPMKTKELGNSEAKNMPEFYQKFYLGAPYPLKS